MSRVRCASGAPLEASKVSDDEMQLPGWGIARSDIALVVCPLGNLSATSWQPLCSQAATGWQPVCGRDQAGWNAEQLINPASRWSAK